MTKTLSENTIRQIVHVAAESLGEQATVDSVKEVVSTVLGRLQHGDHISLPPQDTEHRQKYYTELLGDWLRAVENKAATTAAPTSMPGQAPQREPQSASFIITVLGRDRPGVVAHVAQVLGDHNCSIQDMSQQILNGFFTMIMVVNLAGSTVDFSVLRDRLIQTGTELGVKVLVQHQDVFEYMHRV